MVSRTHAFLIWGAGGHGRVVADVIRRAGHTVGGFVDRNAEQLGRIAEPGKARVLFPETVFLEQARTYGALPGGLDALALGVGDNAMRYECLEHCARFETPALVHPDASISPSAVLGRATVVLARAIINAAARVGRGVIINSGAIVEHDCVLRDAVHVSPGAILCGGVTVGARSWIGAGAVLIPGVRVGSDAIVGAGAVVIRDVADDVTVVGNPARPVHIEAEVG